MNDTNVLVEEKVVTTAATKKRVRTGVPNSVVVECWNDENCKNANEVLTRINARGYNMSLSALRSRVGQLRKSNGNVRFLRKQGVAQNASV